MEPKLNCARTCSHSADAFIQLKAKASSCGDQGGAAKAQPMIPELPPCFDARAVTEL
jgi:hypothetical protein